MELTTHFELHSQATRLEEREPYTAELRGTDGIITLYDAAIPGELSAGRCWSTRLHATTLTCGNRAEIYMLSSSLFTRRY